MYVGFCTVGVVSLSRSLHANRVYLTFSHILWYTNYWLFLLPYWIGVALWQVRPLPQHAISKVVGASVKHAAHATQSDTLAAIGLSIQAAPPDQRASQSLSPPRKPLSLPSAHDALRTPVGVQSAWRGVPTSASRGFLNL